jgi:hypothetical protein
MAMVGMTTPTDTFTPEVMDAGNSGAKLQLAMGPNQIIQDNIVKNCAEGVKDALWLVWRTLIQYGDDYGVKKLAQQFHPQQKAEFMDAAAFDDMNFCERKIIHIDLALGMASEENALQRLQVIKQIQTQLASEVAQGVQTGALTPEAFAKTRRPYEDMLYVLGVKEVDTYLLTQDEVMAMIKQTKAQQAQQGPSPQDQLTASSAQLNQARAAEIQANLTGKSPSSQVDVAKANELNANVAGVSAGKQLDAIALTKAHKATNY